MARNVAGTEMVDVVCDYFSNSNSEREGIQEIYSNCGGATAEAGELDLLAKTVISLPVEEIQVFNLRATRALYVAKKPATMSNRKWKLIFHVRQTATYTVY